MGDRDEAKFKEGQDLIEQGLALMRDAEDWTPGVRSGWVLLVPMVGFDDDGAHSGVGYFMSGDGINWPLLLGTFRGATIKAEAQYHHGLNDDDDG